jgi:DNA-binding protein H-NS
MPTLQELIAQRDDIEKKISEKRISDLAYAVATVNAMIAEYGLTEEDIFGAPIASRKETSQASKAKVPAKYRDTFTGNEWSGRGLAPKWLQGKDRTQYLISK